MILLVSRSMTSYFGGVAGAVVVVSVVSRLKKRSSVAMRLC